MHWSIPGVAAIFPRILAAVHIVVGAACSIVAVPFIGLLLTDPTADPYYRSAGGIFLPLFALYFAPSVVGGIGLLFNARWARTLLLLQAWAYLILFPLGTALGIATLAILRPGRGKASALAAAPSQPVSAPPVSLLQALWRQPLTPSTGVLVAMAIVGPGFFIGIDLLYHLNEPRTPPELDTAALISLPVMLGAIFLLIRSIRMSDGATTPDWQGIDFFYLRRRRWQRESRLLTQEEHQRVKRLAADPVMRKYADLIRNGQHWSDEQIPYDLDPTRLVTCAHIQPIERAMRDAGILVRPHYSGLVNAACCVDGARLQSQFDIQPPVWFSDHIQGDRPYDPDGAAIMCREHGSGIWLVHPDEAKAGTPWFPPR